MIDLYRKVEMIFPEMSVGTDNQGQLIIYTNHKLSDDKTLAIPMEDNDG